MVDRKIKLGALLPNFEYFPGENRVFTARGLGIFAQSLNALVVLPEGYDKIMPSGPGDFGTGFDFLENNKSVARQSDIVLSLKYPDQSVIDQINPGTVLMSMAHFQTRPGRVSLLREREIKTISLDGIVDDNGDRLVEDLRSVAWNGTQALFEYVETARPELLKRKQIKVSVLGSGPVGRHAADAMIHLGDPKRRESHNLAVKVEIIGKHTTENPSLTVNSLSDCDILVDATNRRSPGIPVIKNDDLEKLKPDLIILDLATDYYDPAIINNGQARTMVKAIEGIPTGDAKKFIFEPSDKTYGESIPRDVPQKNRRLVISNGSWPALKPVESMIRYESQLINLIMALARLSPIPARAYDMLKVDSDYPFERALYRGSLKFAEKNI